jgi:hypothetical protein
MVAQEGRPALTRCPGRLIMYLATVD